MEAPEIGGEMHAGATDAPAIGNRALLLRFFIRSFRKGIRLQFRMIREQVFLEDLNFVVCEVGFCEVGALFENDDTKTVCRELFRQDAASRSRPDDYEIDFVRGFVNL